MPIRITCQSCEKPFSAWDDLRGKSVECPRCGHRLTVPPGSGAPEPETPKAHRPDTTGPRTPDLPEADAPRRDVTGSEIPRPDAAEPDERPLSLDERPLSPDERPLSLDEFTIDAPILLSGPDAVPPDAPPSTSASPYDDPAGLEVPEAPPRKRPAPPAPPVVDRSAVAAAPAERSSTDQADDVDAFEDLPFNCPNCEQPMPAAEDLCDHCGYHRILKKVLDLDGIHRKESSTGFERLLKRQLDDSADPGSTLLWTKVAAGALLLLIFLVCLGSWWWLAALLVGGGYAYYYYRIKRRRADTSDINQDPLGQLFWGGLLAIQRGVGWRLLEWPFPSAKALTMRDPSFGDEDVLGMVETDQLQALDLEGTAVGDESVHKLSEMKQLRFLVLRSTRVSLEGAQRVQRALPDTMIWR